MTSGNRRRSFVLAAALVATVGGGLVLAQGGGAADGGDKMPPAAPAAGQFNVDPMHTSIVFKIRHAGLSDVWGRFNQVEGKFTLDPQDASKSSFNVNIPVASVDTVQQKRDDHLRSDDFFDAKQFPTMTFKSSSVKQAQGGFDVTGDLTMHGKTKSVTIPLRGGQMGEFPPGTPRTGFTGEARINRPDWGVGNPKFEGILGTEVTIYIGIEGTKSK